MIKNIVSNLGEKNHFCVISELLARSDDLFVVSPFLSLDLKSLISELIGDSPSKLKSICLITTLPPFSLEQIRKVDSLVSLFDMADSLPERPKVEVRINNSLHAKLFIFSLDGSPIAGLVTSANFTQNGLRNNYELGVLLHDAATLNALRSECLEPTMDRPPFTVEDVIRLMIQRDEFLKRNPHIKDFETPEVDLDLLTYLPKAKQLPQIARETEIWLKPLGSTEQQIDSTESFEDQDLDLNFSRIRPSGVKIGSIIVGYAVGYTSLLFVSETTSYPEKASDEEINANEWLKRWPWKIKARNLTPGFGKNWRSKDLSVTTLAKKFRQEFPGIPLTLAGGYTLGALNQGSDKLRLSPAFGNYLIDAIKALSDS